MKANFKFIKEELSYITLLFLIVSSLVCIILFQSNKVDITKSNAFLNDEYVYRILIFDKLGKVEGDILLKQEDIKEDKEKGVKYFCLVSESKELKEVNHIFRRNSFEKNKISSSK